MSTDNRRPIAARDTGWAQKITRSLIKLRLTPNAISIWSIVFSLIGAACIGLTHGAAWSWLVVLDWSKVSRNRTSPWSAGALIHRSDRPPSNIYLSKKKVVVGGWACESGE